jgi:hypothetical protein
MRRLINAHAHLIEVVVFVEELNKCDNIYKIQRYSVLPRLIFFLLDSTCFSQIFLKLIISNNG